MASSYDQYARDLLSERAYGSIYSNQFADAAKSARANETARRLGIAPDLVEAAMPDMLAEERVRKRVAQAQANQAYARIMSNPRVAAAAIDDDHLPKVAERTEGYVGIMGGQGRAIQALGGWLGRQGTGAYRAAQGVFSGWSRLMASTARTVGVDWYADLAEQGARNSEATATPTADENDRAVSWEDVKSKPWLAPLFGIEQTAQSLPHMVAVMMNPLVYVGSRSGQMGQQRAQNDERKNATLGDVAVAAPFAAASAALERVGVKGITGGIRNPTLRGILDAGWREGATEYFQSGLEYFGAQAGTEAGVDPEEMFDQMEAGLVGGVFGGSTLTAAGSGVRHVVVKAQQTRRDVKAAAQVDKLMESAAESPTRQANPSDFEEALNQLVGDTEAENLYVPADKVRELFQDDDGLREDSFWGEYSEQISEAEALGGDVVIPLAKAATHLAGTPAWQQIRDHVRTRPGGMSITEAKAKKPDEEMAKLAGEMQKAVNEAVPRMQLSQAQTAVGKWAEKMGYSGEQAQTVNRYVAAAATRAYEAERQRLGKDAPSMADFIKGWLPKAEKAKSDGKTKGQTFNQSAPEAPEFKEWFGDSKVVDAKGEPLVVYHGTAADFEAFDNKKTGLNDRGLWGRGHYFSASPVGPNSYALRQGDGARLIPTYISIRNPLVLKTGKDLITRLPDGTNTRDLIGDNLDGAKIKAIALAGGHDGVIQIKPDGSIGDLVAFEATQVKSAIGNRGTFDPNDPSILNQLKRGNISIQSDDDGYMRTALIRAFEASNFSTAVHELGHFFLEDLRRRASRSDALDQEKGDWQTFKDWVAELGNPVPDIGPIPVEAHEYFARGMERYVWEGQAPSNTLRSLFYRMRDFMLEIYRTATAFNAPITPEIREVMDRMLASDAEIEQRRSEMKLVSNNMGELLSEAEQDDYQRIAEESRQTSRDKLFERILSSLRQEKTEEVRTRKREIEAEVQENVDRMPVFQALKLLRVGIPTEDGNAKVKLPRHWLVDAYGEEVLAKLPKGVPPIVSETDTMDPDQIAEMTGFDSGDAMVTALIGHEEQRAILKSEGDKRSPRAKLIADSVDDRVREEIGDPFADIEEEAEAALVNERQADLMSMELRALGRKAGKQPTAWKMATEWAFGHVRQQTSREAISGKSIQMYSRNASKAAQEAEEALIKNDFDAAFAAKQRQLLNLALLQEAKRAKDEVDKAVRKLQRIAERETIPSVDQDYLDQAHQLLEDVDMKTRPVSQVDKRKAFEDWHAEQVALGAEPVVPPKYQRLLGKTNWKMLQIEELLELDKAVGQIIQLGRLKQKLRDGKALRDFEDAKAELLATGELQPARPGGSTTDVSRNFIGRAKSVLRSVDAAMLKAETFCLFMDGNKRNGPWSRLIFNIMAEAGGRESDLRRTYVEEINALIKSLPKKMVRSWDRLVSTPELVIRNRLHTNSGQPWQGTKDQVVIMALNWGNAGNRQRLLDGFGWQEAEVLAVFDRLMSKDEWAFVQSVWDTVDKLWPEIEALERRVNGVAPEKVEATEVQTAHGVFRGGYFPAIYDVTQSVRADMDQANKESPLGAWHQATTRSSASKNRVDRVVGRPLLLSMNVITRHMGEVIHDVTHREAIGQVRKLLSDKEVFALINSRMGPEYSKMLGGWLENIAQPGVAYSKANPAGVMIGRWLNRGISIVGLGLRFSTVAMQALGMSNVISEVGSKRMAEGLGIFTAHPIKTVNEIQRRSAEMRSRWDTLDASIEQMVASANSGKLQVIGPRNLAKYAFHGIRYADMAVTSAGWIGAFNKALAGDGIEQMNEEDAALYADSVIRTTQGSGGQKDRSAILNQHPMVTAFYPFFSYLNALYNQQRDVGRRLMQGDVKEAVRRAWWVAVVPAFLQALIFGEGPEPEDDDEDGLVDAGDWARYLGTSILLGNLGSLPLIGSIAQGIGSGYGYRSSAIQSVGEGIVKGTQKGVELATDEEEELTGATIKSTMTTLGILFGQPLGQPGATAQGIYDYSRGEAEPEDMGDWYELLTKGRVSKNPTAIEQLAGEEA